MALNMKANLDKPSQSINGDNEQVDEKEIFTPKNVSIKVQQVEQSLFKSEVITVRTTKEVVQPQPVISQNVVINNVAVSEDNLGPKWAFFLFVNPTSGGNKAAVLTKLNVEKFVFTKFEPVDAHVELSIYSLKDSEARVSGFKTLKKTLANPNYTTRVIVGGGDGTIMWVIEEMIKANIPFTNCPIGCIPFGTGNDFSRVLGWGGEEPSVLIGTHLNNLKGMIAEWMQAIPEDFDIWDITIETYEEGGIRRVEKTDKGFEKKFMTYNDLETGLEKNSLTFKKKMCNYFSFGIDARIGYGFDKSRTTSRTMNKMVYCWEGMKKMFGNTFKVNHVLSKVEKYKEDEELQPVSPDKPKLEDAENDQSIDKIEFNSNNQFVLFPSSHQKDERPTNAQVMKGNPSVFLCLNIPSYMGGASNPWAAAKGKSGVTDRENKVINNFDDQVFGDGKLEIISFAGPMALAMERFFKGQGRRVGQAEGPFVLNFKRNEDIKHPISTYTQIDGEFFQLVAPKCVKLTLAKDIPRGKVSVLKNKEFHEKQQAKAQAKAKANAQKK